MRCPKCTSIEDKVIDSRISKEGNTIRRRRECLECGHRFTTTETLVLDGMVVIKRDGRREEDIAGGGYQRVALDLMTALSTGEPARRSGRSRTYAFAGCRP